MTELLREGRRLTREGQHVDALARFDDALAIDASPWRVQCEAAFIAWRAEQHDAADAHLERALNGIPPGFVPDAQRVPTAMCLFNAGLVHQAHGDLESTRSVWEESLRLRDNDTVRARLAALPPSTRETPPWRALPSTASIDEIVRVMREDFAAHGLSGFEGGRFEASDIPLEATRTGAAPGIEAFRVHGEISNEGGEQSIEALVVRANGEQRVHLLGECFSAGLAASSAQITISVTEEDVLPGGALELLVSVRDWGGSTGYVEEAGWSSHTIVCSIDTPTLQCISLPLVEASSFASEEEEDEITEEGYCREATFTGGRAVFTRCDEFGGDAPAFIDGEHDLRALLGRGDLAWPDTWSPLQPVGS